MQIQAVIRKHLNLFLLSAFKHTCVTRTHNKKKIMENAGLIFPFLGLDIWTPQNELKLTI